MPQSPPRRRRSILKRFLLVVLFVTAGVTGVAGWIWYQSRQLPEWYAPVDPDMEGLDRRAESLEYRVVEESHRIRDEPGEPWTLELGEDDANAWLAARLPKWIEHGDVDWPDELGTPHLHFDEAGLHLAMPAQLPGGSQLLVARFDPVVTDGRLRLEPSKIGVGSVALPVQSVEDMLEFASELGIANARQLAAALDLDENGAQQLLGSLMGAGDAQSLELHDGRRIELLGIALSDGRLEFTNRTHSRSDD